MVIRIASSGVRLGEILELARMPPESISAKDHPEVGTVAGRNRGDLALKGKGVFKEAIPRSELLVGDLSTKPLVPGIAGSYSRSVMRGCSQLEFRGSRGAGGAPTPAGSPGNHRAPREE
jgi:hypothetical protein